MIVSSNTAARTGAKTQLDRKKSLQMLSGLLLQEGGPGPLPDPPVQGQPAQRPLRRRGEHPHDAPVLADRARRHARDNHEGNKTKNKNTYRIGPNIRRCFLH